MWLRPFVFAAMPGLAAIGGAQARPLSCAVIVTPSDSGSGRFGDVAEGRNGRLAWTDGRPGQFLLRDSSGRVRVVGRRGEGPGEFDRPDNFAWKADTLFVSDWRLRRIQVFSDTGLLIRTLTGRVPGIWVALPDDRMITIRSVALADESGQPFVLVSQRPAALSIDTIARFDNPAVERFERMVGTRAVRNHQPFHPMPMVSWSRDGTRACGISPAGSATQLRCTDGSGREILNQQLVLSPRPLTDAIYDSMVVIHLVGGSTAADMRSRIKRQPSLPPVTSMMLNDGGEIWLQRSHRFEPDAVWTRVRPDGSIRDEVSIPGTYRFIRPQGEAVWMASADADGLETLQRCTLAGRPDSRPSPRLRSVSAARSPSRPGT
jgi:hypothetical protein